MTAASIIALIQAIFTFPNEILALVDALKKTPQANHQDLMDAIAKEATAYSQPGGRPQW